MSPLIAPALVFLGIGFVVSFLHQWKKKLDSQIATMTEEIEP